MAKIAFCKACGKTYDYNPETWYEGGTSYTKVVCPHCGNLKTTSINHRHYGDDGK